MPNTARDIPLQKFYVQDFVRQKLQNDPQLRTALLYQEDQLFNPNSTLKAPSNLQSSQEGINSHLLTMSNGVESQVKNNQNNNFNSQTQQTRTIINKQGVKIKSVGNSKEEIVKDLYQKIFSLPNSQGVGYQTNDKVQITNININTTNNNIFTNQFIPNTQRSGTTSQHMTKRQLMQSSSSKRIGGVQMNLDKKLMIPQSSSSTQRKTKNNVFHQSKSNTSPHKGSVVSNTQELNEIFQNNKDAKQDKGSNKDLLLNKLIFNHPVHNQRNAGVSLTKSKEDTEFKKIRNLARFASDHFPIGQTEFKDFNFLSSIVNQEKGYKDDPIKVLQNSRKDTQISPKSPDELQSPPLQIQKSQSAAASPIRQKSLNEISNKGVFIMHQNTQKHIDNFNQILMKNYNSSSDVAAFSGGGDVDKQSISQGGDDQFHQTEKPKQQITNKYLPNDIKHLEHIIQYTQPNQITKYGSILCQRKQCLDNYHSNQCLQKQIQEAARRKEAYKDDEHSKDEKAEGTFEEECENFMRNLQKYYEKFIKNENAFMQKSYLESNMFSNKRRTIENLIKNKQIEHGIIDQDGASKDETAQDSQMTHQDFKKELINKLIGETPEEIKEKEQKALENPYAHLFGVYDYRYYNSKIPPPPKESLGKPSGRKQVQLLNEWFESMMDQYVYTQKEFLVRDDQRKKAFYYSKVILTICIRDLVRQVSVHCIERGAFMEKVLNIYLSIYEAELRAHLHDIDLQKEKHLEQIKNLREESRHQIMSFEKLIDNLNVKIKEITQQRDRYQNEVESMKETLIKHQENQQYFHFKTGKSQKERIAMFQQIGQKSQNYSEQVQSPLLGRQAVHQSSDSSPDSFLAMKKTRLQNQDQIGQMQRQKGIKRTAQKQILIADNSDSIMTEDDNTRRQKQPSRLSSDSFGYSQSREKSIDNGPYTKNVHFGNQLSTLPQQKSITSNKKLIKMRGSDQHEYIDQFNTDQRSPLNNIQKQQTFALPDQEKQMIDEAIDILFEINKNNNNGYEGEDLDDGGNESPNHIKIMNDEQQNGLQSDKDEEDYIQNKDVHEMKELLDDSLDFIEKEQKLRLIQSISEITQQLYQNSDGKDVIDLSKIPHRSLVKCLVEASLKNNQQTIQKLLERMSEDDKVSVQKLIGNKNASTPIESQIETFKLADMLKEGQLSNSQFLQLAQKRQRNMSIFKKMLKDAQKDELKPPSKDVEIQTEDFNFIDYDQMAVETAEIYMFDRVSRHLRKISVEVDPHTNTKIYKQYDFNYKGKKDDILLQLKSSIVKKVEMEFKYKVETKNKHYEINRANRTLKSMLQRQSELEGEIYQLQVQKQKLIEIEAPKDINIAHIKNESIAFQSGYMKGYTQGRSAGYFKGYQEGRHFGHQLGFQDGVKEGWSFGFDDGYKGGIRRMFKDCRDIGINIEQLDILDYINKEDQFYGLKKYAFDKLFKIISKNEKLQLVYKLHERFLQFNERRKKRYAKMGRKNVIKMISQLYQQMIASWYLGQSQGQNTNINNNTAFLGILEYMYDDFSKKYGNVKLAEKKILQILGSTYYHLESHPKIAFFGQCLHLTKKGYSNDVLHFYLSTMEKIQTSNVGINVKQDDKSDIDIVPYLKALDGLKLVFEDKIPVEAYGRIRQEVEKFTITKDRAKVVDLDKLLEHIILNYLRFNNLLANQLDQIYHAFTLLDNYFMTYVELMMLIELIDPERLKVETEGYKFVEIEKKDFISSLEKKKLEQGDINISIFQFRDMFSSTGITQNKKIMQCFDQTKSILNLQMCKEKLEQIFRQVKQNIDDLYRGQKWKNLKFLDTRDQWVLRMQRIEKSVGTLNNQLIVLSASIYSEILSMYLAKKKELYGEGRDDDEEVDLLEMNFGVDQEANALTTGSGAQLTLSHGLLALVQSHTLKGQSSRKFGKVSINNKMTQPAIESGDKDVLNDSQGLNSSGSEEVLLLDEIAERRNSGKNQKLSSQPTFVNHGTLKQSPEQKRLHQNSANFSSKKKYSVKTLKQQS